MYQIQIIKFEKRSPEEMEKVEEARRYNRDLPMNEKYSNYIDRENYKTVKTLDVELTDEEFKAIKKSVIEIM